MSGEDPVPVAEYVDANGNTWQLNEADAKRLGYKRVSASQVEAKVVTADAPAKPAAKRTASTK